MFKGSLDMVLKQHGYKREVQSLLGCAWLSRKKKERVRDERVTREMTISLGWQGSEIGESD
jgi:hypothetical protein